MLKDLITDVKIAATDLVGDIKSAAHDMTTKLPDAVQTDYSTLDKQSIPSQQPLEYMGNGWGGMASTMTANQIDMIADKMNFVSSMIQTGLLGFDSIEEELRIMATQLTPPQPAQLLSIAARIDSTQKQAYMGLQELKRLAESVDKATDRLQGGNSAASGWSAQRPTNLWQK